MRINFFSYSVIIFVLLQVLGYQYPIFSVVHCILFYGQIIFLLTTNKESAITYLLTYNLLSLNQSSYIFQEPYFISYYGLRVLGISFNVLFTLVVFSILFFKDLHQQKPLPNNIKGLSPLIILVFLNLITGLLRYIEGVNYLDNLIQDINIFMMFPVYYFLFKKITYSHINNIFLNCLNGTFLTYLFSLLFSITTNYTLNQNILLVNTFDHVFLISLLFSYNLFRSKIIWFSYLIFYLLILKEGIVLFGGKSIFYIVITILWLTFHNRRRLSRLILFVPIVGLIPFILSYLINFYETNTIAYKLAQMNLLLQDFELKSLMYTKTSIGNIIGELFTIIESWRKEIKFLIFGNGLGGGIKDHFGVLQPWAGNAGYSTIDILRNNYHRMHLSFSEWIVKSGIVGLFFIFYSLRKLLLTQSFFPLFAFILFLTMFTVSKEFIILFLLFYSKSFVDEKANNLC